jgi:hypothetical protein
MWSIENGRKKLDVSKVRADFRIIEDAGLRLVCPRKNMWDWEDGERWIRSVVIDRDGFVVSCAWMKFGNYGEFLDDTGALNKALANGGTVRFTHKHDGSLCIRYVHNGKVILRTRGTLYGGESDEDESVPFGERFRAVAQAKYPRMLDPSWMCDRSLLFEYVAPDNMVVIRYKGEDLIFLGFVKHADLSVGTWEEILEIAAEGGLNLVELHDLPKEPLKLLEEIRTWKDEGIVARCGDDQVFVKVKSAYYLANHRMKYSMNYETMVEFILGGDITSEQGLEDSLKQCDYDWEIIESAKEFYRRYLAACAIRDRVVSKATWTMMAFALVWPSGQGDEKARRKEFAINHALQLDGMAKPIAFCLYDGRTGKLEALRRKIVMLEGRMG